MLNFNTPFQMKLVWQPSLFIRASIALHVLVLIIILVVPTLWPWAVAVLLANHLLITVIGLLPRSDWLGPNLTQLPDAAAGRNEIALTIDDGPDPIVTPRVLDILDRYAAQATFFCIGEKAALYPDLCREIVRRGHAVENHSQHHRHHFAFMGPRGFMHELQTAQVTLTQISGQRPLFFRAPAGLRNPFLDPVLSKLGLTLASWSTRGFDTRIGDADRVKNKLLSGVRAGAILLMHDGNAARNSRQVAVILEVLPAILVVAAANKLRFVTLRHALS